jgi:hypothetical protein
MLFDAREHLASPWLDLAEGRLRLDRLRRNGAGLDFLPLGFTHSSRGKKVSPPPNVPPLARYALIPVARNAWLPIGAMMPAASARLRTLRQASTWVIG